MQMDYCGPRGIPRSRFLRWPRRDQDEAIAWLLRDRAACPKCGTRAEEWDPALGGRDDAYVPDLRKCWGCHTTAAGEKQIRDDMGPGVWVALVPPPKRIGSTDD